MKYCKKCVQPDTRPKIELNEEGVCNACVGHVEKTTVIDWEQRRKDFERIVEENKGRGAYDCIVPVSGGKDSTYQVYVMKNKFKMNPLCLTINSHARTELGQANLNNLIKLGVDHIDFTTSPETERKFLYKALVKTGIVSLPFHLAMYALPLRFAINFKIPLIVWGENTAMEYGGTASDRNRGYSDRSFLIKYGAIDGTVAEDWIDEDLTARELYPYIFPSDEELAEARVQSIYLGYYYKWDPKENYEIARQHGFREQSSGPTIGLYDYADLDCSFIVIHHFIKWIKFGMTRLFDNVSVEIRNRRMTREEGIKLIKETPVKIPEKEIKILCEFLQITESHFWGVVEKNRNLKIWKKDSNGNWYMPDYLKGL